MGHFKRRMLRDPGSYALLSGKADTSTAVVFVHGFSGNSVGTWVDFQNLIDEVGGDWWEWCDLYFYDYSTFRSNIAVQAGRFQKFLKDLFPVPNPEWLGRPSPELMTLYDLPKEEIPLTAEYRRLVLVGHSLGGVIIRQAIADAAVDYETSGAAGRATTEELPQQFHWLAGGIRLFAPAMFGFDPTRFTGFCYHLASEIPRLGRFLKPALHANPVHQELQPDSARLRETRKRTESMVSKYPWMDSLRAHLLFGARENIVYMERYDCDPVFEIVEEQDHQSVCKPNAWYQRPLEFVSYGLSKPARV